MNSKEAIKAAKAFVADVFSGEGIDNIGLEEVAFDDVKRIWEITIGFSRSWNHASPLGIAMSNANRIYKIININNDTQEVLSMKNRDVESVH